MGGYFSWKGGNVYLLDTMCRLLLQWYDEEHETVGAIATDIGLGCFQSVLGKNIGNERAQVTAVPLIDRS